MSYTDTKSPVVTGTEYTGGKVILTFSEEIGTLPNVVRVNGTPVATADIAAGADKKTVEISNQSIAAGATASLYVSKEVTTDNKKVDFKFSEELIFNGTEATLENAIVVKNSDGVKMNVVAGESAIDGTDAKVYHLDFVTGDLAANVMPAGTYTVTIPAGTFKDQYGNTTAAVTSTFTVGTATGGDTTKPVAQVSTPATNVFQVVFNNGVGGAEEVTSSALNLANYKLDGKALPVGTEIYFTSSLKDTVMIELPANSVNIGNQTTGANAVLTVSNVADKAGNIITTSNNTVTVKDNTAATVTNVQVLGTDVYVTFNENLTAPAALTNALAAFTVKVNGSDLTATDVSDLAVVPGNTKQVKFSLTAAPAATPVVSVTAGQTALQDANGVYVK